MPSERRGQKLQHG